MKTLFSVNVTVTSVYSATNDIAETGTEDMIVQCVVIPKCIENVYSFSNESADSVDKESVEAAKWAAIKDSLKVALRHVESALKKSKLAVHKVASKLPASN